MAASVIRVSISSVSIAGRFRRPAVGRVSGDAVDHELQRPGFEHAQQGAGQQCRQRPGDQTPLGTHDRREGADEARQGGEGGDQGRWARHDSD
jgi:hypothetical protein